MSQRDNGGTWTNVGDAARWLGMPQPIIRNFVFHLRCEGKLPQAWDYDAARKPRTAVDQQWIYDNFEEWAQTWSAWRSRVGK